MKKVKIQRNPFIVPTTDGKYIGEHFGKISTAQEDISIAHMVAPPHWSEPFQTPEFDEYTLVVKGKKQITLDTEVVVLNAGESIFVPAHQRVQYANPFDEACEYVAICTPAFSIEKANRE